MVRAERVNPDRRFKIAGREFTFRPSIPADDMAAYEDGMLAGGATSKELLQVMDGFIVSCLEPGQEETWREARRAHENGHGEVAITAGDLDEVIRHMIEVTTGRPTGRRSDSGEKQSSTGTGSTDASPSTEPTPAA